MSNVPKHLTRHELKYDSNNKEGVHITTHSLFGFKYVRCDLQLMSLKRDVLCFALLEIPSYSRVVKQNSYLFGPQYRSDRVIVRQILDEDLNSLNNHIIQCRSTFDSNQKYDLNKEYTSYLSLKTNPGSEGFQFFLSLNDIRQTVNR